MSIEYGNSALNNLPETITYNELRAENQRRWAQGFPDLAMTIDQPDQPAEQPGMPQPGAEPQPKAVSSISGDRCTDQPTREPEMLHKPDVPPLHVGPSFGGVR